MPKLHWYLHLQKPGAITAHTYSVSYQTRKDVLH